MSQRNDEYQRYEFIYEMERLYLQEPFSDEAIGERLGTDRTNAWRIRRIMIEKMGIPIDPHPTERGKWYIHPDYSITHIPFKREQMAALYLAARRLQQQTRTSQLPVVDALEKLAHALRKPLAEGLVKAAKHVFEEEQDPHQQQVFSSLIECWLDRLPVRITHRKLHGEPRVYRVHPYQIEPAVWGDGNYLIGFSEYHNKVATFKLSRIEKVVIGTGKFEIPPDFNVHDLLKYAWGVWHADEEPVTVKLRFNKWVTQRVKESIWHPQQLIVDKEEGCCEFTVQVAEWREMVPWVRGWGSDVEVLEPKELKDVLTGEARRLARMYGIANPLSSPPASDAIAHTKNADGERHNLIKHLYAVAELATEFAQPFGGGELARCLGLWHDVGKFHPAFQTYLIEAEENPTRKQRGPDHKAAGAMIAAQKKLPFANLLIQAHHGGLRTKADFDQWYESRKADAEEAIVLARQTDPGLFNLPASAPNAMFPLHIHKDPRAAEFFLRFVFSALTDADFLDTERHFTPERADVRDVGISIEELWQRIDAKQRQFAVQVKPTLVNQVRQEIYTACLDAAAHPPGLFRLTVPTGGGKTRSGLAFALRHAKQHGLRRVIVAVPFITITEQTANVYRSILESESDHIPVVLEHHSGAIEAAADGGFSPDTVWNRLAAENWDAPIVVTTTVQLFESLFANSTTRCRKLHRLAGSVIVLDEAQALPMGMLDPILSALHELCTHYGSSVVLSTATQPAFELIDAFRNLPATEIVPQPERFFNALSRVEYDWRVAAQQSWAEVAGWMDDAAQVLTIVNTKKDALALLDALNDPEALHLSTLLCGAHRRAVITEVKRRLNAGEACRLVSTQVVEAGVDIDFPLVLRAFGPLDSIIQAAGRANREGKLAGKGRVIIFDPLEGG